MQDNVFNAKDVLTLVALCTICTFFFADSVAQRREAAQLRQQIQEQKAETRGLERGVVISR